MKSLQHDAQRRRLSAVLVFYNVSLEPKPNRITVDEDKN